MALWLWTHQGLLTSRKGWARRSKYLLGSFGSPEASASGFAFRSGLMSVHLRFLLPRSHCRQLRFFWLIMRYMAFYEMSMGCFGAIGEGWGAPFRCSQRRAGGGRKAIPRSGVLHFSSSARLSARLPST